MYTLLTPVWLILEVVTSFPLNQSIAEDNSTIHLVQNESDIVQERIFNGVSHTIQDAPYLANILYNGNHICGGSIITKSHILTAGHCTCLPYDHWNPQYMRVLTGSSYVNQGLLSTVKRIYCHGEFRRYDINQLPWNDIAILYLEYDLPLNDGYRQVIPLIGADSMPRDADALVIGWGQMENGQYPVQVRAVGLRTVDDVNCNRLYPQRSPGTFCAGWLGLGGKDACSGDSGGPLIFNGALTGIVSGGSGCGNPNYPGIYTFTGSFRQWILYVAQIP